MPHIIIAAFSRRYPNWDFWFWVHHSSRIQSVRGYNKFFIMLCSNARNFLHFLSYRILWNCRNNIEKKRDLKLKEDDIFRLAKAILPATNLAISKTREIFSGEPSMTLKVTILESLIHIWHHVVWDCLTQIGPQFSGHR